MKKYINFNTEKRTNAANSFEKDFFKLMINGVFGKTIGNLREIINVRLLVNNEKIFKNTPADQLLLLIKSLVKNMPLFMILRQCLRLTNQLMLDLLF